MENVTLEDNIDEGEVPWSAPVLVNGIDYDEIGLPKTLFDWRWEQKKYWCTARSVVPPRPVLPTR